MRLTPLDIRKQEFSRTFRGYDAEEVTAFLQMLASQWEEVQDENRRREEKIRELDGKLRHYEKVEEALQEALQTARESSRKALQNAEEKAEMMIDRAEARADEIKQEAERERYDLKRETAKLSGRKSEIVTRLRAFLMSEMELLARYEGDDPVGFIKLMPMEESRMRRLSERREENETSDADQSAEEPDLNLRDTSSENELPRMDESVGDARPENMADVSSSTPSEAPPGRETPPVPEPDWSARRHEEARHQEGPRPERQEEGQKEGEAREDARHDEFESEHAPKAEKPARHEPEEDEVTEGPGWTARTVVSRPSEQRRPQDARPGYEQDEDEEDDETNTRASSEEIEKIRRILSDLD